MVALAGWESDGAVVEVEIGGNLRDETPEMFRENRISQKTSESSMYPILLALSICVMLAKKEEIHMQ